MIYSSTMSKSTIANRVKLVARSVSRSSEEKKVTDVTDSMVRYLKDGERENGPNVSL